MTKFIAQRFKSTSRALSLIHARALAKRSCWVVKHATSSLGKRRSWRNISSIESRAQCWQKIIIRCSGGQAGSELGFCNVTLLLLTLPVPSIGCSALVALGASVTAHAVGLLLLARLFESDTRCQSLVHHPLEVGWVFRPFAEVAYGIKLVCQVFQSEARFELHTFRALPSQLGDPQTSDLENVTARWAFLCCQEGHQICNGAGIQV
mmetsp:Transcript_37483/g.56600  ORF Transcript_37483/g.56600 Transcript_37483/m.56600 type:complete len:207 (-) Transcript_37483:257-877(-)